MQHTGKGFFPGKLVLLAQQGDADLASSSLAAFSMFLKSKVAKKKEVQPRIRDIVSLNHAMR